MLRSAVLAFALAVPSFALAEGLTAHGNFRHMMHTGETEGTIALDTLNAPSGWGVGATAGLRGEVVIRDGAVLISRGDDAQARVTPPQAGEQAVILTYGTVTDWLPVPLPHDMAPDRLTHFIEMQAKNLGIDPEGGFPIRIEGSFPQLVWHVVTGEAPAHGAQSGHGGGHANSQSRMNLYDEAGASGEIIGVYTGAALEGIASRPGERLHLHFVSADVTRSGHVDEVVFPAGSTLLLPAAAVDEVAPAATASPYSGMESREIKSLSAEDIEDLRAGRGWGLALAAELNGVPGPSHLLELKDRIGLSPEQVAAIEVIFAAMKSEAQAAGERLIAAEAAIEAAFRTGNLTPVALRDLIDTAATARAKLRYIHLSRHLETPPLLTAAQISRYNDLRGYGAADPCTNVPKGHDPAMWRRHNNCQ
jgi:alpha-acetolactate decarboxylase